MPVHDIEQKVEDYYRQVQIPEHGEPVDAILDPALQADALAYDELVQAWADARTALAGSLSFQHWVGRAGLEPATDGL